MRPIDADALLKRRRNFGKDYALDPVDKNIDDQLVDLRHVLNAPTLDYAPVIHASWIPQDDTYLIQSSNADCAKQKTMTDVNGIAPTAARE